MIKVLIINPLVPDYRLPIFNSLAEKYDLTICHSGSSVPKVNRKFKEIKITRKKVGPFTLHELWMPRLLKNYDVIISEANIRYIDILFYLVNPFRSYKWILWGIGVSASYTKKFDEDKRLDFLRFFMCRRADANLFYSEYPVKKYIASGFDAQSLFVANNTVTVYYDESKVYDKNSLMFVGTLYKQKGIMELLEAYRMVSQEYDLPVLNIIGGGEELENISHWIENHILGSQVVLHGPIYDKVKLHDFYRTAIACISPGQAGLSVLSALGSGTPLSREKMLLQVVNV